MGTAQQQFSDVAPSAFNFDNLVKGALDGFGNGSMNDIVGTIEKLTGGQGSNIFLLYYY